MILQPWVPRYLFFKEYLAPKPLIQVMLAAEMQPADPQSSLFAGSGGACSCLGLYWHQGTQTRGVCRDRMQESRSNFG